MYSQTAENTENGETLLAAAWQEDPEASPEDFQLAASGHSDRSQGADRTRWDL